MPGETDRMTIIVFLLAQVQVQNAKKTSVNYIIRVGPSGGVMGSVDQDNGLDLLFLGLQVWQGT